MAVFNKFNAFTRDLGDGVHNFPSQSVMVALSNTAPLSSNSVLADITQITAGNGYATGGLALASMTWSATGGVARFKAADAVFTASVGSIATFRYVILYNDTPVAPVDPLIGWWDFATAVTITVGNTFTVDIDPTNGIFTIT